MGFVSDPNNVPHQPSLHQLGGFVHRGRHLAIGGRDVGNKHEGEGVGLMVSCDSGQGEDEPSAACWKVWSDSMTIVAILRI